VAYRIGNRLVLIGDHTKTPNDGRKMPAVTTLHQDSETGSKPSYFRGHHWGCISLLVQACDKYFAVPLEATIQEGWTYLVDSDPMRHLPRENCNRRWACMSFYVNRHGEAICINQEISNNYAINESALFILLIFLIRYATITHCKRSQIIQNMRLKKMVWENSHKYLL
jgi:hypothetical protein